MTADHLLRLAHALGLNPVDLMLRFGVLSPEAVRESARELGPETSADQPQRSGMRELRPLPHVPPL